MKIFFLSKKFICILILFIALIIFTLYFLFSSLQSTIPVGGEEAESFSEKTIMKIQNLVNGKEKIAYLTFDDGPSPDVTSKILDILKEEHVKASFFVIGKYVDTYPEITKRAYDEGHYIANHGYSHDNNILYKSESSFINEIQRTDLAISSAIGVKGYSSHIFRFPNGYMSKNNKQAKENMARLLPRINYTYIDWNCLNNDSVKKYSKEQLLNNLKSTCKGKNTLVILMHDTKFVSDSSIALKDSIKYLKSQGYSFRNFYSLF